MLSPSGRAQLRGEIVPPAESFTIYSPPGMTNVTIRPVTRLHSAIDAPVTSVFRTTFIAGEVDSSGSVRFGSRDPLAYCINKKLPIWVLKDGETKSYIPVGFLQDGHTLKVEDADGWQTCVDFLHVALKCPAMRPTVDQTTFELLNFVKGSAVLVLADVRMAGRVFYEATFLHVEKDIITAQLMHKVELQNDSDVSLVEESLIYRLNPPELTSAQRSQRATQMYSQSAMVDSVDLLELSGPVVESSSGSETVLLTPKFSLGARERRTDTTKVSTIKLRQVLKLEITVPSAGVPESVQKAKCEFRLRNRTGDKLPQGSVVFLEEADVIAVAQLSTNLAEDKTFSFATNMNFEQLKATVSGCVTSSIGVTVHELGGHTTVAVDSAANSLNVTIENTGKRERVVTVPFNMKAFTRGFDIISMSVQVAGEEEKLIRPASSADVGSNATEEIVYTSSNDGIDVKVLVPAQGSAKLKMSFTGKSTQTVWAKDTQPYNRPLHGLPPE